MFDRRRQEVPLKQAERRFTKSISKNGRILLVAITIPTYDTAVHKFRQMTIAENRIERPLFVPIL